MSSQPIRMILFLTSIAVSSTLFFGWQALAKYFTVLIKLDYSNFPYGHLLSSAPPFFFMSGRRLLATYCAAVYHNCGVAPPAVCPSMSLAASSILSFPPLNNVRHRLRNCVTSLFDTSVCLPPLAVWLPLVHAQQQRRGLGRPVSAAAARAAPAAHAAPAARALPAAHECRVAC